MKRLALDLSTVATGWAFGDGPHPLRYGTIAPPKKLDLAKRLVFVADAFYDLVDAHDPEEVVIEELHYLRGMPVVRALAGLRGVILYEATRCGLPVRFTVQGSNYKAVGLPGNAKKEQVLAHIRALGFGVANDNEADAVCVYKGGNT